MITMNITPINTKYETWNIQHMDMRHTQGTITSNETYQSYDDIYSNTDVVLNDRGLINRNERAINNANNVS